MAQDYGLKVSKNGYDINTASVQNQIFNSTYNSLKIIAEGQVTISVPSSGSAATTTVAHGLSYIPGFLAYAQLSTASESYIADSFNPNDSAKEDFQAWIDSTNLTLSAKPTGSGAYTAYIYYYILADPGQ